MRIQGDGRQRLREHVDGIRFSSRVTPLEAGVPGFGNTVGLDRQVGCLFVSLSVYLQGWTIYTASQRTSPSDRELFHVARSPQCRLKQGQTAPSFCPRGRGVGRGAGCVDVWRSGPGSRGCVHMRMAQPPRHHAGKLQRQRFGAWAPRSGDPRCWQKEVESCARSEGKVDGSGESS